MSLKEFIGLNKSKVGPVKPLKLSRDLLTQMQKVVKSLIFFGIIKWFWFSDSHNALRASLWTTSFTGETFSFETFNWIIEVLPSN